MLARLAARILIAPVGFVCGVIAAFATVAAMATGGLSDTQLFPEEIAILGYDLTINAATVALLFAPLMGAPAIVAVLIGEMFSLRSWIFYAAAGAGSALLPWSLAPSSFEGPVFTTPQVIAAGLVGGLVHWLIAGRRAGLAEVSEPRPDGPPDRVG
ncbi:hypothetical protein [Methylopila sp. M107]|uniref:hypothetical protein n=1 Tax=Methylopila sp. M107 TaxID=1101190 RepID=UPI0003745908|nr:hypothetical protein [Methylopila sp. M107]